MESRGIKITRGTIEDATLLHAPSATKNREQKRNPEDESACGSRQKDEDDSSAVATAANVADSRVLPELLHGEDTKVWVDQAYRAQSAAIREVGLAAQDLTHKQYRYKNDIDEVERAKSRNTSRVRSKVEHVFAVMLKFGFVKLRYRGLRKNANQLTTCALANLFLVRSRRILGILLDQLQVLVAGDDPPGAIPSGPPAHHGDQKPASVRSADQPRSA